MFIFGYCITELNSVCVINWKERNSKAKCLRKAQCLRGPAYKTSGEETNRAGRINKAWRVRSVQSSRNALPLSAFNPMIAQVL